MNLLPKKVVPKTTLLTFCTQHSFSSDSGCVNGDCIPATGDGGCCSCMTRTFMYILYRNCFYTPIAQISHNILKHAPTDACRFQRTSPAGGVDGRYDHISELSDQLTWCEFFFFWPQSIWSSFTGLFLFFFPLVRGMRATQCASKFSVYSALQNNGGTVKKCFSDNGTVCPQIYPQARCYGLPV